MTTLESKIGHFKFSNNSLKELSTCHWQLQQLFHRVLKLSLVDFSIIQGARTIEEAQSYFDQGKSELDPSKGQYSKHISPLESEKRYSSLAIDICPWVNGKLAWDDMKAFGYLGGLVCNLAMRSFIDIRWGGNWNYDGDLHDNSLEDPGHYELLTINHEED